MLLKLKIIAIQVTQKNYPNTIQLGDVNNISYKDGVIYSDNGEFPAQIDLVCYGSPCTSFGIAMRTVRRNY